VIIYINNMSIPSNKKTKKSTQSPFSYQDFVIRDGKLVGDWEGLYKNFENPWNQSNDDQINDSRRMLCVEWCKKLRKDHGINRVIELGCGFGFLTSELHKNNFAAIGTDISEVAIAKARYLNKDSLFYKSEFNDFKSILRFDPDIIIMAEITWYVLDQLDDFIKNITNYSNARSRPTYLIHLLTTYLPGQQKYGIDRFTNLDEILSYFGLNYIESGFVRTIRENDSNSQGTYFVAKI
jgi:predicted TPR repeat methyltransferase